MRRRGLVCTMCLMLSCALAAAAPVPQRVAAAPADTAPVYRLARKVPLGAPDRWDYVVYEGRSQRAFVAHGDHLDVVDTRAGRVTGRVPGIRGGPHGIALIPELGKGYSDDGEAGVALAFDLQTLGITRRIQAGADADAMILDPASRHVFVMNGDTGTITVIDPREDRAVASIEGGGKLEAAASDGRGRLYVNGAGRRELLVIDTARNAITARHPLPDCASPHGLALDREHDTLFVTCLNRLMQVVDAARGRVIASLPIGSGTDGAAWDPVRRRAFSSNGQDGDITVVGPEGQGWRVLARVPTAVSGRTLDIDPASGRLFVVAGKSVGARRIAPGSLSLLIFEPVT